VNRLHYIAFAVNAVVASTSLVSIAAPPPPTASTATIAASQGSVFISGNSGLTAAYAGMPLQAGTRIYVLDDSRATVDFPNGDKQAVPENTLLKIDDAEGGAHAAIVESAPPDESQAPLSEPGNSSLYTSDASGFAERISAPGTRVINQADEPGNEQKSNPKYPPISPE